MVEDFPATLKAIFDPNYGNIRPVSQPNTDLRSRNFYRKSLVIYTFFGIIYLLSAWYTEKAGRRFSKKY
jgi:hypothetical protein